MPPAESPERVVPGSSIAVTGVIAFGGELSNAADYAYQAPPVIRPPASWPDRSVPRASAVHQRDYVGGEPLQALDALRDGLAATLEDQLVHADRRESSDVAGDLFRRAGEEPAGAVR